MRPTLYAYGPNEDELSREHRVVDHADDGAPGLYSMIGGKLASYRLFAEEMTDVLARSSDAERTVPHAHRAAARRRVDADRGSRSPSAWASTRSPRARLVYRHGARARAHRGADRGAPARGGGRVPVRAGDRGGGALRVAHELARTVDDVARRTRLGLGACGGMRCAARCGQIVAEERQLSPREGRTQAVRFLAAGRTDRAWSRSAPSRRGKRRSHSRPCAPSSGLSEHEDP